MSSDDQEPTMMAPEERLRRRLAAKFDWEHIYSQMRYHKLNASELKSGNFKVWLSNGEDEGVVNVAELEAE